MGNNSRDDETVLFLFISFAALITLLLILILISCQTWMLWKMAKAVVEQDVSLARRNVLVERGVFGVGGGEKRKSVRSSVYGNSWNGADATLTGSEDEHATLMSGGIGDDGKRRPKIWGLGRWI